MFSVLLLELQRARGMHVHGLDGVHVRACGRVLRACIAHTVRLGLGFG